MGMMPVSQFEDGLLPSWRGFDPAAVATAEDVNNAAINHLEGWKWAKLDLSPGQLDFKTYPSNAIPFTYNMCFYSLISSSHVSLMMCLTHQIHIRILVYFH